MNPGLTCKNKSTIDYFISTVHVFPIIKDLQVPKFSSLYSDAHCPVSCMLNVCSKLEQSQEKNSADALQRNYNLWNSEKKESFVDNFDTIKVSEIEMRLDQLTHSDSSETSQNDIDEIISDIGSLFSESAKSTFG